jgi:WD40 repeat protein
VIQKANADAARKLEEQSKLAAQRAESEANAARHAEAYEAYVARIQLAAAKIEENAFDTARRLLEECRPGVGEQDLRGWEWMRLMHLCHQSEHNWKLEAPVESVAFSPDGTKFATAAWDGHARVVDLKTNRELLSLKHQGQYVHAAVFSPDGKSIATGSNDSSGFVRLWDATTGAPLKSFYGHTDAVLSVRFSKDGRKLLTSSYDNTARLWDVATGKELRRFEGHFWWVWSAAFSPDEKCLVTASHDGTANVYDALTGKRIAEFTGHKGPVFAAEFSPDGRTIATGGFDRRVLIWKPEDQPRSDLTLLAEGRQERSPVFTALDGHTSGVRTLQFSSKGQRLVTGSDDNTLKLWNLETNRPVETLRGHNGWIACCALSPDEKWAVSAGHDQQVRLWNLGGYEETRVLGGHVLSGHGDAVLNAAISPDGTQIATASRDRTARLWSALDGRELKTFAEGHSFSRCGPAFLPTAVGFSRRHSTTRFASGTWPTAPRSPGSITRDETPRSPSLPTADSSSPAATTTPPRSGRWIPSWRRAMRGRIQNRYSFSTIIAGKSQRSPFQTTASQFTQATPRAAAGSGMRQQASSATDWKATPRRSPPPFFCRTVPGS